MSIAKFKIGQIVWHRISGQKGIVSCVSEPPINVNSFYTYRISIDLEKYVYVDEIELKSKEVEKPHMGGLSMTVEERLKLLEDNVLNHIGINRKVEERLDSLGINVLARLGENQKAYEREIGLNSRVAMLEINLENRGKKLGL